MELLYTALAGFLFLLLWLLLRIFGLFPGPFMGQMYCPSEANEQRTSEVLSFAGHGGPGFASQAKVNTAMVHRSRPFRVGTRDRHSVSALYEGWSLSLFLFAAGL